jgi:hypothetical protein
MCEVSRKGPKELSGVFRPWREKIFRLPLPSLLDVPSSEVPFVDSIAERNKARGKAHPHPSIQDPGRNRWMFCPLELLYFNKLLTVLPLRTFLL